MTTIVSEREEGSFLDYILELARKEMASSAGQGEDEATEVRPVSGGAGRKDSTMTDTENAILCWFWALMLGGFMLAAVM